MSRLNPRQKILKAAQVYVDFATPYRHQGRDKVDGVDCCGLHLNCIKEAGYKSYDKPEYRAFPRVPQYDRQLVDLFLGHGSTEIPGSEILPGDIAFFWMYRRSPTWLVHTAFVAPGGLIHTHSRAKKVTFTPWDDYWKSRYVTAVVLPMCKRSKWPENNFINPFAGN